jgi:hypothetical protein
MLTKSFFQRGTGSIYHLIKLARNLSLARRHRAHSKVMEKELSTMTRSLHATLPPVQEEGQDDDGTTTEKATSSSSSGSCSCCYSSDDSGELQHETVWQLASSLEFVVVSSVPASVLFRFCFVSLMGWILGAECRVLLRRLW